MTKSWSRVDSSPQATSGRAPSPGSGGPRRCSAQAAGGMAPRVSRPSRGAPYATMNSRPANLLSVPRLLDQRGPPRSGSGRRTHTAGWIGQRTLTTQDEADAAATASSRSRSVRAANATASGTSTTSPIGDQPAEERPDPGPRAVGRRSPSSDRAPGVGGGTCPRTVAGSPGWTPSSASWSARVAPPRRIRPEHSPCAPRLGSAGSAPDAVPIGPRTALSRRLLLTNVTPAGCGAEGAVEAGRARSRSR